MTGASPIEHGERPGRDAAGALARAAGVHLDHGRKHYGADWIARLLRRMAELGLTELQLHVSENEGFRIPSASHPELVSRAHLSHADIASVREVAREVGITIVPSLDVPGHMRHVLASLPGLALSDGVGGWVPDAIDLDLPEARAFVAALHAELAELFPESETWHVGFDEIVPADAPWRAAGLAARARARFGADADEHDLLTAWANGVVGALADRGIRCRLWNDAMLRSRVVQLDTRADIAWWTAWNADFAPLSAALERGHRLVNCNDSVLYHVLGEAAGYAHPTVERLRDAGWHPGVFPTLPDGTRQELASDDPRVVGSLFCIWSDRPEAESAEEVLAAIDGPLAEFAARAVAG